MTETDLWYGTSGPPDADIVIVGESWGVEEHNAKRPFIGQSGVELNRMLAEAGIQRDRVLCSNVVGVKPQNNETWRLFLPKHSNGRGLRIGGLLPSDIVKSEVARLYRQITHHPRKLVIGTGNFALWALTQRSGAEVLRESNQRPIPPDLQTYAPNGIMNWRGSMWHIEPHMEFVHDMDHVVALASIQFLPIIHPAAIMRDWAQRAPTLHDLKSRVPMALRADWRPDPPPIKLIPSFREALNRLRYWLDLANRGQCIRLANDIETLRRRYISVMGFADSTHFSMCIPFIRRSLDDGSFESYWTPTEEGELLYLIRMVLSHPNIAIIGQNYIYDTQYIQVEMGVTPNLDRDTMLVQNVVFPGTPKDLGYLSSLYCKYHWYWKDDVKDWNTLGDVETLMDYNCEDNLRTWEIDDSQRKYVTAIGQDAQVEFKMYINSMCLRMMNRGILVDIQRRGQVLFELQDAMAKLETELLTIIPQDMVKPFVRNKNGTEKKGQKYWYRSAQQTATLFYEILGFRQVNHRKTGNRTVGKEALLQLKRWYPEFSGLFTRLRTYGAVDNTVDVIQSPTEFDSRMRCSYNPGGTETHRLSSSANVFGRGTNLQNLTKGEEDD